MHIVQPHSSNAEPPARSTCLLGRYRLDDEIASGGMATVYRALDYTTGEEVALKTIHDTVSHKPAQVALFEREYRTLASLAHPRIISVYDYGLAEGRPFYTMELLDGQDVGRLAPLDYETACAHIRDAASCVALLHARGLLHRDISARNIRVGADGRSKLIDFGALTGFGTQKEIIGTPPCVPPEAVRRLPLDARSDLFGLGAVLYYLVTGRHAYPGRSLEHVATVWQTPPPKPSEILEMKGAPADRVPPPELDELVLSLLSVDPAGRPTTAGYVIERLNVIAGLSADTEVDVIDSYLAASKTVGRQAELDHLEELLRLAKDKQGTSVVVAGPSGCGKTRVLSDFAVEARIGGAIVLSVDAEVVQGNGAVARRMVEALFEARPEMARTSLSEEQAAVLVAFHPALSRELPDVTPAPVPSAANEWRMRVQGAIVSWLESASEQAPLVCIVDNVDRADELSSTLMAALALSAKSRRLMVVAGADAGVGGGAGAAVERLRLAGESLELSPLSAEATLALMQSVFGDALQTVRLAQWAYEVSGGSPLHTLELARHLVQKDMIRFLEGTWVLPLELSEEELPQDLDQVWNDRLSDLEVSSRMTARAVSIYQTPFTLEQASALCDSMSEAEVREALDDLMAHGVLTGEDATYRFLLTPLRQQLFEELDDVQRKRLHARVADYLGKHLPRVEPGREAEVHPDAVMEMFEVSWHRIQAGDTERGVELGLQACRLLLYNTSSVSATHVPFLENVLSVAKKHDNRSYALLLPLALLGAAGYTVDRHLAERYGDDAIEACRRATGLALAARLRGWLGLRLGGALGLLVAMVRFFVTPGRRRGISLKELFQLTLTATVSLVGTATICRDVSCGQRLAATLEPLTAFGKRNVLALFHEYATCLTYIVGAREPEAYAGWQALLARLDDPSELRGIPEATRQLMYGGALYSLGVLENLRDSDRALDRAAQLESMGLRLYELIAAQLRTQYHVQRGEMETAAQWAARVELLAVQKGTAWQIEVWIPGIMGSACYHVGDLVALKRAREQLEMTARSVPGIRPGLLATRGRYLILRGDYRGAIEVLSELEDNIRPGEASGWASHLAFLAEAYNLAGLPEKGRRSASWLVENIRPECRPFVRLYLWPEVQLAVSEALLGRFQSAAARLDTLLEENPDMGPILRGSLHEARARVALLTRQTDIFERHMAEMERLYRSPAAPGLLRKCERLRDRGRAIFDTAEPDVDFLVFDRQERKMAEIAYTELTEIEDPGEVYRRAIELIVEHMGAAAGYLFVLDSRKEAKLVAQRARAAPADWLVKNVRFVVQDFETEDEETRDFAQASVAINATMFQDGSDLRTLILATPGSSGTLVLVGAAAVLRGENELRSPSLALLEQIASALYAQRQDEAPSDENAVSRVGA